MPGATTEQALAMVEEDLSDLGLTAFDRQDSQKRDEAVARTIAASLKYLSQSRPTAKWTRGTVNWPCSLTTNRWR